MGTESYKDWLSLYNENLDKIWKKAPKELRKLAMLSAAYEIESKNLSGNLKSDLISLQDKLAKKKELEREYLIASRTKTTKDFNYETPTASSGSQNSTDSAPNASGKDTLPLSPSLSTSKKSPFRKLGIKSSPTEFKTPDLTSSKSRRLSSSDEDFDCCIIECTPDAKQNKHFNKLSTNKKAKERFLKTKTSTSKFLNSLDDNKSKDFNDTTFIEQGIWPIGEGKENKSAKLPSPKASLNKSKYESRKDSKLNEIQNDKIEIKSRKMLPGWSCKDCEVLYDLMDLPEEEKIIKMNECSRHKYQYGAPENTIAGYWDLNMDTQK